MLKHKSITLNQLKNKTKKSNVFICVLNSKYF